MTFEQRQRKNRKFAIVPALAGLLAMQAGCNGGIRELTSGQADSAQTEPARPKERMLADGVVPIPSGGTVVVSSNQQLAVVSEAISSQIIFVDLQRQSVAKRIALRPGDQPGQCVEGSLPTEFFCVLRTGSAVIRIRAEQQPDEPLQRAYTCHEPRGLAFAAADQRLYVACDGGELLTVETMYRSLRPRTMQRLEPGLHDIQLISGSSGPDSEIWVSRRRQAKVYKLIRSTGESIETVEPKAPSDSKMTSTPTTASRLVRTPGRTGAFLLHELGGLLPVAYYQGCVNCDPTLMGLHAAGTAPVVAPSLKTVNGDRMVAPLDMALLPTGEVAVIAAGNRALSGSDGRTPLLLGMPGALKRSNALPTAAMPVAVAATKDRFVVQTIGRASLWSIGLEGTATEVPLLTDATPQPIRPIELFFASDRSVGLACASCHPDGRDDGHRWIIQTTDREPRRTLSLRGTLAGRSAYRRTGSDPTLSQMVQHDFTNLHPRSTVSSTDVTELTSWLLKLPPMWNATDGYSPSALARGEAVYKASCASCHGTDKPQGSKQALTDGGPQLVAPFLVDVKNHAPYFTDGCAVTLRQTLDGTCKLAGRAHQIADSASDQQALLDYLATR